jgi:hypothetical protein
LKYAREIIELMAAYPGREFKMDEIVRYIAGSKGRQRLEALEREAVRRSARNALKALADSGCVSIHYPSSANGSFALYRWGRLLNTQHEAFSKHAGGTVEGL